MSSPNHPVWFILKVLAIAVVMRVSLGKNYENSFDLRKDGQTIVEALAVYAGIEATLRRALKSHDSQPSTE